ncbi:hypothetical protein W97_06652 [Coniosporium apollinis CBS 100218]|uniref:Kinesin motor domain-containing protein n=1 Tax=Coniosporium apollinis (strain CBS 100218) TaxID=1168221 RepID=R7Z028_CONA1|nr:uncharacterized protein W97_06652 [Coniosporium apollinis CBS 100218]EON67399.1 hypothetical protein W97_06652 [Coniosporium apollinis CBS 100218]
MATSPPASPAGGVHQRPMSAMIRSNRSSSRMSASSKHGGGSRASDEDTKTAVKVAIRVRPPIQPSDPGYELIPQRFRGSTCHVTTPTSLAVESAQGKKLFIFDRVFGEDVDQESIWGYLNESVSSFVQGYNVSILAYGQSGAGKSYTMGTTGTKEQSDPSLMGVVPRAAAALFEKLTGSSSARPGSGAWTPSRYSTHALPTLRSLASAGDRNWQLKATYVEIYNEQLRDLLVPENVPQSERTQVMIREDPKGRIILTGLQQVTINSIDDLLGALNFGSSIRQTDATAINAKSSRSHAVFSLNLIQKKNKTPATPVQEKRFSVPIEATSSLENSITIDSKLHFVDLAGSERMKNTGAQGDRAKEGISINAGLASLGKVIAQLSSRAAGSHVSYRDSRLTRLLQDSLGGNAITYMVACVNPAEFHLSETLNTVQYAQRARAIQSKPQIQQVSDDSDKQAMIDRLRAEVSFLRDQIRLSERTERRNNAPQERAERQHEREAELQNQLLDIQENYNALSKRHAKLISEITKAGDNEDNSMLKDTVGNSAVERLKRSNSFAEAVEQVVLEYEKTIQSLEASLSNTRGSLASSESTLMEKETKITYMETVTQQLQARIQKAMDREANNEQYLHDLESRIDGITSGEEKNSAIIQELRRELSRTRENETSCEEYISTLEERLAEAEQDHELMQREIDRLEHVVERQRSIGKLDHLLYELDHVRQNDVITDGEPLTNGHSQKDSDDFQSVASYTQPNGYSGVDSEAGAQNPSSNTPEGSRRGSAAVDLVAEPREMSPLATRSKQVLPNLPRTPPMSSAEPPHSPAQSKFVADKLETVTQELFDLRMEHETAVNDYDELARKYEIALNTLAEMQDAVDEARRGPVRVAGSSFLVDAGVNELKEDGQSSSSRTLSSELSSLGESTNTPEDSVIMDTSNAETMLGNPEEQNLPQKEEALAQQIRALKRMNAEKEESMVELSENYAQLEERHRDALEYVGELKVEIQRVQLARPASPTVHVIRRKSSQNITANDRANRSCAALRTIATEEFEGRPDVSQTFELNVNAVMTELHMRSERVQALEAEVAAQRKDMEAKMTIISGLTRERSSLKSSPMDISVVSAMRDQLLESENQIRELQRSHADRERELQEQVNSTDSKELGSGPTLDEVHDEGISRLRSEVDEWKAKHFSSMESMKASERQLLTTIHDLEDSLRASASSLSGSPEAVDQQVRSPEVIVTNTDDAETSNNETTTGLKRELTEYKKLAAVSASKLAEVERSYHNVLNQVENDAEAKRLTENELQAHRDLIANLERQIEEQKAAVALHQQGLDSLRESHKNEIEDLSARLSASKAESEQRLAAQLKEQGDATVAAQELLERYEAEMSDLLRKVSAALGKEIDATTIHEHVLNLLKERTILVTQYKEAAVNLKKATEELDAAQSTAVTLRIQLGDLQIKSQATSKELDAIREREKKSYRLVEELEEQLNSNYDQHHAASNRLSALQSERQVQLEEVLQAKAEVERELEESRARVSQLEVQLTEGRRSSRTSQRESLDPRDIGVNRRHSGDSNLRKSASHTTLPSPPPAIPLPPLPGGPPNASNTQSPPSSRHQSKDLAQTQLVEEQEARIRTIEKHLFAEKQLTATLEEALTDLESSSTKTKSEIEAWRKRCAGLEEELNVMKKERNVTRYSLQAVEEERNARLRVEAERAHLEARMAALNQATKKKKKSALMCF